MDLAARARHTIAAMEQLDLALRLLAAGQLALVALVIWRSAVSPHLRRVAVGLMIGIIGYLANSSPYIRDLPLFARLLVLLASNCVAPFLWLFTHVVFDRRVDRRIGVAACTTILACAMVFAFHQWTRPLIPWADLVGHVVSALLALHAMYIALTERDDDLVEARRRFRAAFVLTVAGLAIFVLTSQAWFGFGHEPAWMLAAQTFLILLAVMVIGAALLEADPALLAPPRSADGPPRTDDWSPAERVLREKLDAAMAARLWLEPGLTIGLLAARLEAPEHRLRALINRRLGYRNFSAFLNAHRIAEAKAMLADPARVDLPVLTIAMDLGYGSLAPFNRAFRETVGLTPTELRRSAFADHGKP